MAWQFPVARDGAERRAVPATALGHAVRRGLESRPRWLPPHLLYDDEGSRLFDEICALPEYYLARAETEILAAHAAELVERLQPSTALVELGSGSGVKTGWLLQSLAQRHRALSYVPVDISPAALERCVSAVRGAWPAVQVHPVVADYTADTDWLDAHPHHPRLLLWLGSTVGNMERADATAFLRRLRSRLTSRDRVLLGVDLRKSPQLLHAAYNDAAGVTARFNLNVLRRLNRELDADFHLPAFQHRAHYDEVLGRVEMHLRSTVDQVVTVRALDLPVQFRAGDTIHTESSHKYSPAEIGALARDAGMAVLEQWMDRQGLFSSNLLVPVDGDWH